MLLASNSPHAKDAKDAKDGRAGIEICILAGGLSTRMGRDKARLKIGGATMLARIRSVAEAFGVPVRVLRKDRVRRCGPLGGIVTALRSSEAQAVLFLACDMPLISLALLKRVARLSREGERVIFVAQAGRVGFPFLLPVKMLVRVEAQITAGEFSLQALAEKLRAHRVSSSARSRALFNVNTPEDAVRARAWLQKRPQPSDKQKLLPVGVEKRP